jgi:hypothetical protein
LPTWLAVALAAALGLVTVHRAVRRDVPGALMSAGMAVMAVDMSRIGPELVHGPWWAAGFAAVALWPLVRRVPVCGGRRAHLLCGLAMVYMCALPSAHALHHGSVGSGAALPASTTDLVTVSGHHGHGAAEVALPGAASGLSGAVGTALALLGWGLACYFLLSTVSALTRREAGGALAVSRASVLGEAAMALGSVVMLVALS